MSSGPDRDFFISYTGKDESWATWIELQLRDAGYTTFIQAYDIRPGTDFVHEMQRATDRARCTIAVLSPHYLGSAFGEAEWRVAFSKDPSGELRQLIPVRVGPVAAPGLLSTRVYLDLVGLDEPTARQRLLSGVDPAPKRPTSVPFPGVAGAGRATTSAPASAQFPGAPQATGGRWHDPALSTCLVLDATGAVVGTAFLVGTDVAVTSTDALGGAEPPRIRVPGVPASFSVLEADPDDGLGVALVKLDRAPDLTALSFSYEDVNIVGRPIRVVGRMLDGARTTHDDAVARAVSRRLNDRTGSLLELRARPARTSSGAPVVDSDTGLVVGVLRRAEPDEPALAVPFSEIGRRWPVLAEVAPQTPPAYDTVVPTHLPTALARSAWRRFSPDRLHCVVVTSEAAQADAAANRLDAVIRNMWAAGSAAKSVWQAFRAAATRYPLVDGSGRREIPEEYARSSVALAVFGVLDAYDSARSLELASRLVIEADLALFDVTGFEPGIMLLLGIRAATRRGVTLVSHGNGWRAGGPLNRPFNLSDLALASHTPPPGGSGPDRRKEDIAKRAATGFDLLVSRPLYKDMPVYDALRVLGPRADARRTIPLEDEILVLCSYDTAFYPNWQHLQGQLQQALADANILGDDDMVVRLQDVADPQLVTLRSTTASAAVRGAWRTGRGRARPPSSSWVSASRRASGAWSRSSPPRGSRRRARRSRRASSTACWRCSTPSGTTTARTSPSARPSPRA